MEDLSLADLYDGRIVRGIAGFYYVYIPGKGLIECKAKGVFRNRNIKPLVGDLVSVCILSEEEGEGNIEDVYPRKSELIRPSVANVDQALVIFSASNPEPNLNLLDRFLAEMERQKVSSIICFNKRDLIDQKRADELAEIYEKAGYTVLHVSAHLAQEKLIDEESMVHEYDDEITNLSSGEQFGDGMQELRKLLRGKVTTVAGPSGAGKSSIVNLLQGQMTMETGEISVKLGRGRHTTRRAELLPLTDEKRTGKSVWDTDSFIVDTPGFSSIYVEAEEALDVQYYFPEIAKWEPGCRFQGCAHIHEPDCAVLEALERGEIALSRYDNYCLFFSEIRGKKKY